MTTDKRAAAGMDQERSTARTTDVRPAMVCGPAEAGALVSDDGPAWIEPLLRDYFSHFEAPRDDGRCECGERLGGLFGTFTWGIRHGDGFCGKCKRPARAYHYLTDPAGKEIGRLTCCLLYRRTPKSAVKS